MIVRYQDGRTVEGVIRSLTDDTVHLALKDADGVTVFTRHNNIWVSEDCDPVTLRFGKASRPTLGISTEEDSLCSASMATRLVDLLLARSNGTSWIRQPAPAPRLVERSRFMATDTAIDLRD